jgi:hypothetical protein
MMPARCAPQHDLEEPGMVLEHHRDVVAGF